MTVSLQTLLDRSNRNMDEGTYNEVRQGALEVIRRAYKEGIYVQISEGYRSNSRQQILYDQGRTTSGNIVTNAKPGQSLHNYGVAVDYFLVTSDGQDSLWTVNKDWRRVAAIAKSLGFEWGGDWSSFRDYPHLQMCDGLSLSDFQHGKRPNFGGNSGGSSIVKTIQDTLNDRYHTGIAVDGYPGEKTLEALIKGYQSEVNKQYGDNLVVDGIWGDKTKGATLTVKKGVRGNITWIIQARLICLGYNVNGLDSIFGNGLEAAIKRFQADQNIYVDGQAGKVTFSHMFE